MADAVGWALSALEGGQWIDVSTANEQLEVQVRAGRLASRAHEADGRAGRHILAHANSDPRQVRVPGPDAVCMLEHDALAEPLAHSCEADAPGAGCASA